MKENQIVKLSDVCDLIPGFAFKSSEFGEHHTKAVKIGDIQPPYVNYEGMAGVDISKYSISKLAKYEISKGDFVLAMTGATIGKIGRYISETGAYINQRVLKFKPHDDVNADFIYYVVSSATFQKYILNNIDSETAQPNISAGSVGKYEFTLPSIEEQNRIADVLVSIDNKIQINRQINDNLEQQAQAAFNNIIANTTSDKTVQLAEIAWLNPKRSISKGTIARSIEMAHLPTTGSFPSGWEMKEYNGGMKFQNGDTLMARITPCLENGKVAFVNFLEDDEIAFGSTEYITMTPKRQFAPEVLYFLVRNAEFIDFAVKNMNGSSGRQRVSADTIGTYELPDITLEELHILETIAREALTKIKYNSLENMRLAEMRDTLLPKLMSGELKINK